MKGILTVENQWVYILFTFKILTWKVELPGVRDRRITDVLGINDAILRFPDYATDTEPVETLTPARFFV